MEKARPLLILIITLFLVLPHYARSKIFNTEEKKALNLGAEVFATVTDFDLLKDGYLMLVRESRFGNRFSIFKFNMAGEIVSKYSRRGFGPGEMQNVSNILVTKDSVMVSEATSPVIHVLDTNLNFKKDIRTKLQGRLLDLGKYFGVWQLYNWQNKQYMIALYSKNSFEFVKYVFEIQDAPESVFAWGGICKVDESLFAGVYSNEYQIVLLDKDFRPNGKIIQKSPDHIESYTPYKGKKNVADQNLKKWLSSWSIMYSLDYCDGCFVLRYVNKMDMHVDIFSNKGDAILLNHKLDQTERFLHFDGKFFWILEREVFDEADDRLRYWIYKKSLNTGYDGLRIGGK